MTLVRFSLPAVRGRQTHRAGAAALGAIVAMLVLCGCPGRADAASPSISSIAPASGSVRGGESVTINGSGFVGTQGGCGGSYDIWFGTDLQHGYAISPSNYQVLSDSQIEVTVPANFGGTVDVRVHNACGTSAVQPGDRFSYVYPAGECLAGSCSVAIAATSVGTLSHAAMGFLDGFNTDAGVTITTQDAALVEALHPRQWRLGQAGLGESWGGEFGLARHVGAQISLDLTSDWQDWAYNSDRPYYQAPYGDLSTYYTFIYNDVEQRLAAGQVPDYFDVWNEPSTSGTVNQWLSVYGTAYRAIEAADPGAKVVGPSIDAFLITSAGDGNQQGNKLSLSDFLNWEMTSGVRMAAISWHEDGTTVGVSPLSPGPGLPTEPLPGGFRDYWAPAAIAAHVNLAKALIAGYPALAKTQVFVNEYGPTYAVNVPGWMVGDFAALEDSGADQGMITCVDDAACTNELDGLIGADGTTQMPYWVMSAYSHMSGDLLASTASGSNVYTLATRPTGTQTVQALVGRADDCWGGQQCPQFHASVDGPVQLSLTVAVTGPGRTAKVTVERLPNTARSPAGSNDVPTAPSPASIDVLVQSGSVTVPLGSAGDGDAFYVTITPDAASSAAPAGGSAPASTSAPASIPASGGTPAPPAASLSTPGHTAKPSGHRRVRHAPRRRRHAARARARAHARTTARQTRR